MSGYTTNTHLSVPIVCGEYMRATGFFYRTDLGHTYLVTAAHNVIPMEGPGGTYETSDTLPEIDIFLPTETAWSAIRIDVRDDNTRAIQPSEIDLIGVEVSFDPEEYGVKCWGPSDILNPEVAGDTVHIVGYDGSRFPDPNDGYGVSRYEQAIKSVIEVSAENTMGDISREFLRKKPFIGYSLDESDRTEYTGLSGSPVISTTEENTSKSLVGIHVADDNGRIILAMRSQGFEAADTARRLTYYRGVLLKQIF